MNRREFIKALSSTALSLGIGGLAKNANAGLHVGNTKRSPNVILIVADDQGTVDANCFGAKDLLTPNMDALARRGIRFSQHYVAAAVCSPSRGALLTGRYPLKNGVASNSSRLHSGEITFGDLFKHNGYRTGFFGKWHMGMDPNVTGPLDEGFDEFVGNRGGCLENFTHSSYFSEPDGHNVCGCDVTINQHDLWRGKQEIFENGTFYPDILTRETNRFIEENKDRPFFAYVAFNVPHYPEQGEDEYVQHYEEMGMEEPRKSYAAFVSTLDEKIGLIMAKLDELKLRDNTMVIYLSDHGYSVEARASYGGGSSGIFRGTKFQVWEGGIRVPCIASYPGVFAEGDVRDQMVISMDWLPTCATICGLEMPKNVDLDGKNILPILRSRKAQTPHDKLFFQWGSKGSSLWAVRKGDWKLVSSGGSLFLSNMAVDPTERVNIIDQHPDKVTELQNERTEWLNSI